MTPPSPSDAAGTPTLSVAVCTRERPEDLEACGRSVLAEPLVDALIISSDGIDSATDEVGRQLATADPRVRFQRGPRRGLAANRNACIDVARSDNLLFLDDDARLLPGFAAAALPHAGDSTLVTGWERRTDGRIVRPHTADFLGFQTLDPAGELRSIVINATVFPLSFLRHRPFDEFYRYGYEELDMSLAARSAGLSIVGVDHGNLHLKVDTARSGNVRSEVRSRLYFGVRRYREYEPSTGDLARFVFLGPANAVGHAAKTGGWRQAASTAGDAASSLYKGFRPRSNVA